ncbi:MAG: hypothetical protein M4579_002270 [Chaenotheca gracillima]|nr:MAG: hypothetical protein M4579_002270 [Chaenotheca gracillima]
MFSSLNLFREISCPEHVDCRLPNCLFSHEAKKPTAGKVDEGRLYSLNTQDQTGPESGDEFNTSRKRRKVEQADTGTSVTKLDPNIQGAEPSKDGRHDGSKSFTEGAGARYQEKVATEQAITTIRRSISPPSRRRPTKESQRSVGRSEQRTSEFKGSTKPAAAQTSKIETLNPRLISNPPASHVFRLRILSKIHEQFNRLNEEHIKAEGSSPEARALSAQDIITMALDEEEKIARETPSLYSNIIKNRIMTYTKMKLDDWKTSKVEPRLKGPRVQEGVSKLGGTTVIETGLSELQEAAVLRDLTFSPADLGKWGYVVKRPTEAEVKEALRGVEVAQGWEVCDRCKTRFQVFPGRREDGRLTTGGKCSYHWGKVLSPSKKETLEGHVEKKYGCCNESLGTSTGCTVADSHVFKVSEVKRLASVLQFEETPAEQADSPRAAVCFDCEMCYTTYGLELVRMTVTGWPKGEEVLDILVRPLGEILDLNSRFSGVWPADIANAKPFETLPESEMVQGNSDSSDDRPSLPIVPSPVVARSLFFKYLSRETALIGHALENDLNASRIIHPFIVDSALLYPPRGGLPYRNSLKMLMRWHLDRDIQLVDSKTGHDSKEDARAAGDLVRLRVGKNWKKMKRDGWWFSDDGVLHAPEGHGKNGSGKSTTVSTG